MTVQDIANDLVALCKAGEFDTAGEKYWADEVVSIEAMPGDMARVEGKDAARAKGEWWAGATRSTPAPSRGPTSTATSSWCASPWT